MSITKDIISDLFPLYAANECSADTRRLVDDYLRQHPQEAAELQRIMNTSIPELSTQGSQSNEMEALLKARRIVRWRSWLMGLAFFFSLVPFSVLHTGGRTYWLLIESPMAALSYGVAAVVFWVAYAIVRSRWKTL